MGPGSRVDGFFFIYLSIFCESTMWIRYYVQCWRQNLENKAKSLPGGLYNLVGNTGLLHTVRQEVHRLSPGSANHIMIIRNSYIYYDSFLANGSKDLEEGMPFRIHAGMPPGLAATWVTAECPDDYGTIW